MQAIARGLGRYLAAAALVLVGMVRPPDVQAHGVSLDLHHPYPVDSAFHQKFLLPWTQKVEKEAGGRIRFHLHPGVSQTDGAGNLYDQVREGKTDIVWTRIQPSVERFPRLSVFEYPFMVRRAEGASRALAEYVRMNDLADRDFDGVRLLAVHAGDGSQLHWRAQPGGAAAGLTSLRVAVSTPVEESVLQALGATPVRTAPARIAEALTSGSLDGALLSWERAGALGVDRAAGFHEEFGPANAGLTSAVYVLAMNPDSYRGLPEDLRAVFDANSGPDVAAWLGRVLDEAAGAARSAAQRQGDAFRVVAAEETDRWRTAAKSAADARTQALEQAGARMQTLMNSANAYLKRFDASQ